LSSRRRIFAQEYLVDMNATQAAIRAGYSEMNTSKIGPELLGKTRLKKAIDKGLERISDVPLVRAKTQGFYDGKRIRPGEVFDLDPEHPIGKWMKIVGEGEGKDPEPQIGIVAGQVARANVSPAPEKPQERNLINGKVPKPVSEIRRFCIGCVGGSVNGRKPLKQVRECPVVECPLHPFRMGKNPFDKRNLTETQRKAKAALISAGHFPDNLS